MPLLSLPPETLKQIFDHVGSSFFRADLGRLTVCKQWFDFARLTCFKDITLSWETLRMLISSGDAKRSDMLKDSLEILVLGLRGYQRGMPPRHFREYTHGPNPFNFATLDGARTDDWLEAWINTLDNDIAKLAIIIQQSRRLRIMCIQASSIPSLERRSVPRDYLSLPTIKSLLSVDNLSILLLDLPGSCLISPKDGGDGCHLCPAIGALLRTLKTLHIRMRSICPDILRPKYRNGSLHLSEVVINLSLLENVPGITSESHSKRCGTPDGGLFQLKAGLRKRAKALSARMMSPKIVRILDHTLPNCERRSLDVLTGKAMILDPRMAWDQDGRIIQGEEEEPESDTSDLSSFSDE